MFEITDRTAKITSFNPRAEKHGKDVQPAADLDFACLLPSFVLSMFSKELPEHFFWKDPNAMQGDLADAGHPAPNKRFGNLLEYPQKLNYEMIGAEIIIGYGIGGDSDISITDCKIKNFKVEPQEGGTVALSFQAQFHQDEEIGGRLSVMVGQEVQISLIPPASDAQLDLEGQGTEAGDGE